MTEEKIYRIVAASLIKGAQDYNPCKGCGGEDCACCEIWIERQQDQRSYADEDRWFGDDRYGRDLDEDEYDEYESDEDAEWIDIDDLDEDVDMDEYDERFVRGRYQYRLRR